METLVTAHDADERVKAETFGAFSSASPSASPTPAYGTLTYTYDADGHVTDKGGTLAAVNIPAAVSTTSYSATDQVTKWNSQVTYPDAASNLTYDPATGVDLTWNARNQVSAYSFGTETYDGLGRRESTTSASTVLDFEHDGSAMIGWNGGSAGAYNFLTTPGGGALAGSYTLNGTTTTWVPLIDAAGSTIALVNAANVAGGPLTTYTYDPSGNPTVTGTANDWPFQYQGMEKEFTDGLYYYTGSGQFYSPELTRSLSEVGETSSSGPGGGGFSPAGMMIPLPSGSSGGLSPQSFANDSQQAFSVGSDIYGDANQIGLSLNAPEATYTLALPFAIIGGAVDFLVNFFEDILGGSDNPPIPRQLRHNRHPLYPKILGISDGLIPTEASEGRPPLCGDPQFSGMPALQKTPTATPTPGSEYNGNLWNGFTTQDNRCSVPSFLGGDAMNNNPCIFGCCQVHDNCYKRNQCNWSSWILTWPNSTESCCACNDAVVTCTRGCLKK